MSVVLIGSIYCYIQYNLARYSVYYASHMPRKEGAKPELVMALENIYFIDKPNTENVHFDEAETSSIYIDKNAYFTYFYKEYYLGMSKKNGLYFFNTDSTGKFVNYSSIVDNKNEEPLGKEMLQEIEGIVTPATEDLIKAQKTPTINLQGLFNQKYEARFNE